MALPIFSRIRFTRPLAIGLIVVAALVLVLTQFKDNPSIARLTESLGITKELSVNDQSVAGTQSTEAPPGTPPLEGAGVLLAPISADEILRLVNEYRKANGLPEIVKNDRFCELANARAKEIATTWGQDVFAERKQFYFQAVCIKCKKLAELIARNATNPQAVVDEWLNDEPEKSTLAKPYNIGCVGGFSPDQQQAFIAFEMGEKVGN